MIKQVQRGLTHLIKTKPKFITEKRKPTHQRKIRNQIRIKTTNFSRANATYGHGRLPEIPSFKRSRNDRCRLGPEPIGGNDGLLRADDDAALAAELAAAFVVNVGGEDMMTVKSSSLYFQLRCAASALDSPLLIIASAFAVSCALYFTLFRLWCILNVYSVI